MVQTENAVHAVLYLVRVFVNGSVRMRRREMEYRGGHVVNRASKVMGKWSKGGRKGNRE